jgi:hypothetical protein
VSVSVGCGAGGCQRDGSLLVTVEATDDKEVFAVDAAVDLDSTRKVALTRGSDGKWTGTISLDALEFPVLTGEAVVTVRAWDGARNMVPATAGTVVTRVRWEYPAGATLTPAAVTAAGEALVGRNALADQLLAVHPDGTKAWSLTLGGATVTTAPSIGAQAIWVGANDGKLYAVKLDGSGELTSRTCTASGTSKGPPAVLTTGSTDVAFGAFSNGRIYASGPTCVPTAAGDPFSGGVVIDGAGAAIAASSTATTKALHRYPWDGEAFTAGWSVALSNTVVAPLALASGTSVISASVGGELERTTIAAGSGTVSRVNALAQSLDEQPIVLANGDIVVGDASGKLHRLDADGRAVWDPPVDLGAAVHAPMVLTDGTSRTFLVATDDGKLHALDDAGAPLWSGPLTSGPALGPGNLYTPPGARRSIAYFGGADGKLYAVLVEGWLDTSAPWPKAWHDARNTSRAGGGF